MHDRGPVKKSQMKHTLLQKFVCSIDTRHKDREGRLMPGVTPGSRLSSISRHCCSTRYTGHKGIRPVCPVCKGLQFVTRSAPRTLAVWAAKWARLLRPRRSTGHPEGYDVPPGSPLAPRWSGRYVGVRRRGACSPHSPTAMFRGGR